MTVLVLADDRDPCVEPVISELARRDCPAVRFDTRDFPQRLTIDAEFSADGWTGELRGGERSVRLHDLRSIWRRSPTTFDLPDDLSGPERRHARNEAKLGLAGVLMSLPVLWVNAPDRAAAATYKPVQLAVAAAAGLEVSRTLVTNEPGAVRRFCRSGVAVTKMLGAPAVHEAGGRRVAYTERMSPALLADLRGVEHTAHQFQGWIAKRHEARVIAVGGEVLAVAIHAHSDAARTDWRSDYASLCYERVDPPGDVVDGVRSVMTALGLTFGAFDFVVDPDGRWWFLEVNPGGQYGWLEEQVGIPVTRALADVLEEAG